MQLRAIAGDCKNGSCPTGYLSDRNTSIVQGYVITDPDALKTMGLPAGETAVEVPTSLILEMAAQIQA
jgi:hypothetical protein